MNTEGMTLFLMQYLETAEWADLEEEHQGLGLEWSEDAKIRALQDCDAFLERAQYLIEDLDHSITRIAHDFWLTRNRHGAGFWDGDYPEPQATQLTSLAESFGECYLYVSDDNELELG